MPTFKSTYKIRYSELDCNLSLKPSSLLQLLQDIASEDAQNKDFGYSFLATKNLAWFLLKYHIEFNDIPKGICDIDIQTESRGYNKLFAFRDFEIFSNNISIARATTTWGLIDLNTKSIGNIVEILSDNKNISHFENREDDLKYNKIGSIQNLTNKKEFIVRYDDLDVNQHVNNSNYILWALEALDFDFRKNKNLKTLDIVFKKEAKYTDAISSEVQVVDNMTIHAIKNKETKEDLCLIQAIWK